MASVLIGLSGRALILDLLAQAEAVLGEVARIDRGTLSDEELVAVLQADERIGRFCDASRVVDAGEVAERSRYELGAAGLSMRHGEPKPTIFVERITRVSQSEASRRIRLGSAIRQRQSLIGEVLPGTPPSPPPGSLRNQDDRRNAVLPRRR